MSVSKQLYKTIGPLGVEDDVLMIYSEDPFMICYPDVCIKGRKYVLSLWVKASTYFTQDINFSGQTQKVDSDWSRINFKFTAESTDIILNFPSGYFYLCMAKLECNDIMSDWTEAPEDFSETIDKNKEELNSKITQTAEDINLVVSKKVGKDEIISQINQTAEAVTIDASKINLNGAVTANGYFKINTDGTVEIDKGRIDIKGSAIFGDDGLYGYAETVIDGDGFLTQSSYGVVDFSGKFLDSLITCRSREDYNQQLNGDLSYVSNPYVAIDYDEISLRERHSLAYTMGGTSIDLETFQTHANFQCYGSKNRAVETKEYGTLLQNALESPVPTFMDYGEGELDDTGNCRIYLDDKFMATIDRTTEYTVFLTKYGPGDIWVSARDTDHIDIKGSPSIKFSWEILATQRDYNTYRLEEAQTSLLKDVKTDPEIEYAGYDFLTEYEEELTV